MLTAADDERWMRRCLELARRGAGRVSPNPPVGAVVLSDDGAVVAEGFHAELGGPHAEAVALQSAGERARAGTLYVSLEPCSHHGKTPPCTDAVLASGVRRVVYGAADPVPGHGGGGERLESQGVEVTGGVLARECRLAAAAFFKHSLTGLPFVTAKWAMSLDGKTAARTGDSKWISCAESRGLVHEMRAGADCVMVGAGTLRADDPVLTARPERDAPEGDGPENVRQPLRIVVAGSGEIDPASRVFNSGGGKVLVATPPSSAAAGGDVYRRLADAGVELLRVDASGGGGGGGGGGLVDMAALARELGRRGLQSVLLEGGGELAASAFAAGIVDEVAVFVAPKLIGGRASNTPVEGEGAASVADALGLVDVRVELVGTDTLIRSRVGEWQWLEGPCDEKEKR